MELNSIIESLVSELFLTIEEAFEHIENRLKDNEDEFVLLMLNDILKAVFNTNNSIEFMINDQTALELANKTFLINESVRNLSSKFDKNLTVEELGFDISSLKSLYVSWKDVIILFFSDNRVH